MFAAAIQGFEKKSFLTKKNSSKDISFPKSYSVGVLRVPKVLRAESLKLSKSKTQEAETELVASVLNFLSYSVGMQRRAFHTESRGRLFNCHFQLLSIWLKSP